MTTPELLYVLLGSESGRKMLATTRSVIVDEIHAVAPNKRGAHLSLSLERLAAFVAKICSASACPRRKIRSKPSAAFWLGRVPTLREGRADGRRHWLSARS